jgi:molybdopterin molybdotransferase
MLRPEEAWARLAGRLRPLPSERLARQAALLRVAASAVAATADVPAHDVSAMDGFALPPADLPPLLEVAATVAAGDPPGLTMPAGRAVRIMTGAPLPAGADRVVPIERCEFRGSRIAVREDVPPGANIRRRGEIHRRGERILAPGALLTPGALALLATHGLAAVDVHRAPRVAVLSTGDEVVTPETTPAPGQLRDSHTDFLLAACRTMGLAATPLGIAPDRAADLARRIETGLASDVLLVSGGVSLGAYDLVEGALGELGCEILCDAVAMQPGKPLVIAAHAGGLVFGLPGNPASSMVAFWLFVRPALRRLLGLEDGFWQGALAGTLVAPLPAARDRDRFLPAAVRFKRGLVLVEPFSPRGSHDLGSFARGSALVRVRAGAGAAAAGEACEVLPLVHWPFESPVS